MLTDLSKTIEDAGTAFVDVATKLSVGIPSLINIVGWFAVLFGVFTMLFAFVALRDATKDGKPALSNNPLTPMQAVGLIVVSGAFISFSTTIGVVGESAFGGLMGFQFEGVTFKALGQELDENGQKTIRALFQWVWFLGFVFSFSGLATLTNLIKGRGNNSGWKVLLQILFGSACMNAVTLLVWLNEDFGIETFV